MKINADKMNKHNRLHIIRELLLTHKVKQQEKLLSLLHQKGIHITQATLSRDLSALRVSRVSHPGAGYIYTLPDQMSEKAEAVYTEDFPVESIRNIRFSGNLGVLKTLPSFAPTVGLMLDKLNMEEVTGTVAGDDTVLIILNENTTRDIFMRSLLERIPRLRERI